jgi:hypothetical protein
MGTTQRGRYLTTGAEMKHLPIKLAVPEMGTYEILPLRPGLFQVYRRKNGSLRKVSMEESAIVLRFKEKNYDRRENVLND